MSLCRCSDERDKYSYQSFFENKHPSAEDFHQKYEQKREMNYGGYKKDSYEKDSYEKDSYKKDDYEKDSYEKDSYKKDSYEKDSYKKDDYEKDSYEKDSYKKDDYEKDSHEKDDREKDCCDSESARALKKILSLVDELNNQDLLLLDDVIERLLCSRFRRKVY